MRKSLQSSVTTDAHRRHLSTNCYTALRPNVTRPIGVLGLHAECLGLYWLAAGGGAVCLCDCHSAADRADARRVLADNPRWRDR
jgi:hypothetical protein